MHQIFPKVNQVFSYHLENFEVIHRLMESVSLRVDAEEQYQKALNNSALNISSLSSEHPLYSKIIRSFKSLINERTHQIRFFKIQLANEAEVLKKALIPLEQKMKMHLSELKSMEKDLKLSYDTLVKHKTSSEQKLKEFDEKFILNEISVLYKQNLGLRKNSENYLAEQQKMIKSLQKDCEVVRVGMTVFETGAQQHQKKICELDIKVEEEFVDFFKKVNVHEISLIRNIQYDIDTMIKKTDIFNWQNTNEFKDQFSNKTIEQLQLSLSDPYVNFKRALVCQQDLIDPRSESKPDETKLSVIKERLKEKKEHGAVLEQIKKNYPEYRDEICEWIQSFRKTGTFKFQLEDFHLLAGAFREILKCAIACIDFECVQKIIMYGNSYFHLGVNHKKTTVLDEIQKEKILKDLNFWKFYLLWTIRQCISTCKVTEERQIYLRNGVYSTLLSSALNMVNFGIEKHSIKNLIGKLSKTFSSLTEGQVVELLRVIQTAYQNNQKSKKLKKE